MKSPVEISFANIKEYEEDYKKCKSNSIARHALAATCIDTVALSLDEATNRQFKFDVDIKTLPVTNQMKSGRCWIFSACNVLREIVAKKSNIANMFELSQNYIAFYDKFEKCNYIMESIIDLINKDHDDRYVAFILQNGVGDGGQWEMFVNLVKKYGFCPKNAMVETYSSSNTAEMNALINASLREFAARAKKLYASSGVAAVRKLRDEFLLKFYNLCCSCFGVPPTKFDFEYTDSDNKYHLEKDYTPKDFFEKFVGSSIDNYISLINSPTEDKPFYKTFTIDYLGNVVGGNDVVHLNLPMERMKELIKNQLDDGNVVWFGSDVGRYRLRDEGIWDDKGFDYLTPFGLDKKMDKAQMLDYYSSAMNHAMVITGYAKRNDEITKWKIENSWGKTGNEGFYMMSSSYFDSFVYQAVIDKKYLNEKELDALKQKPILLKPWDPMGTLAD